MTTRATYNVTIRWAQGVIAYPTSFDAGATTAYDDISGDVIGISIRRGRSDPYQAIGAGICTLRLRDAAGKYVAGYASGVLVGGAADGLGNLLPLRTLRVRATHNSLTYDRFYGFITRIIADPDGREATIEASDVLSLLARPGTADVNTGGQGDTLGVAATLIYARLTSAAGIINGAIGATWQGTPVNLTFPGGASTLDQVGQLMEVEQGLFWGRADGFMVFLPRAWHDYPPRNAPLSTLTQLQVAGVASGVALDGVVNRATAQKTGGTAQVYAVAPFTTDGQADAGSLVSPYFGSDSFAANTAAWIVGMRKAPRPVSYAVDLDGTAEDAILVAILARDLHDRVRIDAIRVGQADYFIIGIEEQITDGRAHTCRWMLLRRRPEGVGFVFGYSGFADAAFG